MRPSGKFGGSALLLVYCSTTAAFAQFGTSGGPAASTVPAQAAPVIQNLSSGQLQGSVASGEATASRIPLTLDEAIARGLKNNLGILVRESGSLSARASRTRALSGLLPNISASITENAVQNNLQTFGINAPGIPRIVGPFEYTDVRASASQTIFDWTAFKNLRTAQEGQRAQQLSALDARDLVVQAVATAYFQIIASAARVDSIQAQVDTAQALYKQARDQKEAGTAPGIDVLRAQVELKSDQQQLFAQRNQLEKDKLTLARVIGLPPGQGFDTADKPAYTALTVPTVDEALHRAYSARSDYQSAQALVRSAEEARKAATGQRYPTLGVSGNYGDVGLTLANSHGTFSAQAAIKFNIFDGGRVKADEEQADATLKQRRDELADVHGQIDFQVRAALLDLRSTADQVEVAAANRNLASQTLVQAKDRFAAGVTNNVEVVQAQQQVAAADQNYISALFAHNLAKVSLSRAYGQAESALKQLLANPEGDKK